jgi:hypothetical protein
MLTTGTNDRSLDRLLLAAIEHTTRNTCERGIGTTDQKVIRDAIDRDANDYLQSWKQDVIATWRHNRRQGTPALVKDGF